jgi:hypothetical protein
MAKQLTKLVINEVSSVDRGANEGAKVLLWKRDDTDDTPLLFNDIIKLTDAEDDRRKEKDEDSTGNNDDKLSDKLKDMVDALIVAAPSLDRQAAAHFLMNHPQGRKLAEHLNNISKKEQPMDIFKVISITEQALMAGITKRDGENYHTAFARKFENDIEFRKQWRDLNEAKQLHGYLKSQPNMMRTKPTEAALGPTDVNDDKNAAYDDLMKLVAEQRKLAPTLSDAQLFARVMADPANVKLAARSLGRSSVSYDAELDA